MPAIRALALEFRVTLNLGRVPLRREQAVDPGLSPEVQRRDELPSIGLGGERPEVQAVIAGHDHPVT